MSSSEFASGGCRCGAVSVAIKEAPKMMVQCHCKDCQKASGTGHFSLAFFSEDDVIVDGMTKGYAVTTDRGTRQPATSVRNAAVEFSTRIRGDPG